MKTKWIPSLLFTCALPLAGWADDAANKPVTLANFDAAPSAMIEFKQAVKEENVDGDADKEGVVEPEGYACVAMISLSRADIAGIMESTPVFAGTAQAQAADNPGQWLTVTVAIQTDVSGKDLYEPVKGFKHDPVNSADGAFSVDLSKAATASIPSVAEAAKQFAAGQGKTFRIRLIQQTAKGKKGKISYDDLRLESAQAKLKTAEPAK